MFKIISNGVDYTDYMLSVSSSITFSDNTVIGNVASKQFDLSVDNSERIFNSILNQEFIIFDDDTQIGVFKVYEKPEKMTNDLELTLYDNVVLTNVAYNSVLAYPSTIKEQLDEMSGIIGVQIDYSNVLEDVLNLSVNWWDNTLSIREHMMYIAELTACNVFADATGKLIFQPLSKEKKYDLPEVDGVEQFTTVEQFTISKVRYDNGVGTVFEYGNDTGSIYYLDTDNSYIEKQEQVEAIGKAICGLSIMTMEDLVAPEIVGANVGDIIKYYDNEDTYYFMLMSIDIDYYNAEYNVMSADGKLETQAVESVTNRVTPETKIKKVETRVDNAEGKINIISKEVEGNKSSISNLEVGLNNIKSEVSNSIQNIYKFEAGSNNIFSNCYKLLSKTSEEKQYKSVNDMPYDINIAEMRNKDICISANIFVENGVMSDLNRCIGVEFEVGYADGTKKKYSLCWYLGSFDLQYLIQTSTVDHDERIWIHFKTEDKEVTSVSNLKMFIDLNADRAMISNPKVEFGTYPTGFEYDLAYVRDNIQTIEENYTLISQEVSDLSLKSVSQEREITTIKGNVSEITTRLQNTEIKLQPTNILLAVNEQLGANGTLYTTKFTLDKKGGHFYNGGIDITNSSGEKVFYGDTNGNLTIKNLTAVNGTFSGTISGSTISATTFIYQNNNKSSIKINDYGLRLYGPSGNGFIGMKTSQGFALGVESPIVYAQSESSDEVWNAVFSQGFNMMKLIYDSTRYIQFQCLDKAYGISIWASDRTLKNNIYPSMTKGIEAIKKISHKSFNWIENGKYVDCGYIAQELIMISKDFVIPIKQPNGNVLYQINETALIPVITKALQEVIQEVEVLKSRVGGQYQYGTYN